jgi:hypothetical protein
LFIYQRVKEMNEISILMYLLSKKDMVDEMGSTKEEILDYLKISGRNRGYFFRNLLIELSNYITPLGLEIQFNPLNNRWFLAYKSNMNELISANPFQDKPRLAATLFCAIVLCLKNNGVVKIAELQKARRKKDIRNDIAELELLGYIETLKSGTDIRLTPLIGYQLNLEKLFMNLSIKLTS